MGSLSQMRLSRGPTKLAHKLFLCPI